ncbi:MAG TPA: DUF255 domain-containing protein [Candidatus Dormibacteraeota bacterium]
MAETEGEFHFSPRPNRAAEIKWRAWSEKAFDEARLLNRPILLSISAVWCHWCHVMDETTYSHAGVIDLINSQYVPIRVDNDVRPDINQRYNMGGWPTTAFLTTSGDILTGATYLPPDQMADALIRIAAYYGSHQAEIAGSALESRKRAASGIARNAGELDDGIVDSILDAVTNAYDPEYGGFGNAPKFPQTEALLLLLEQAQVRSDPSLRQMAVHSLERMAAGGIYDHVEGGFFRYSTTQDWSVPHFEKMLEDHAGLISAVALAGLDDVLDTTTGYLDTVLRDEATGLYAGSQDADEHYYSLGAGERPSEITPYVDRRVYTSWNAALAVAYLDASLMRDRPKLRDHAVKLLHRLFQDRYSAGRGLTHTEGAAGQLGDQVWGLLAAVRAHQAGLGDEWLPIAMDLAQHLEDAYADRELGGYFDHVAERLGRLIDPIKPLGENSIAAMALGELDSLSGQPDMPYATRARRALASVAGLPAQYGLMAAAFARALDRLRKPIRVSSGNADLMRAARLAHPYAVIDPNGDRRAVVCLGTICLAPVSTPAALEEALQEATFPASRGWAGDGTATARA